MSLRATPDRRPWRRRHQIVELDIGHPIIVARDWRDEPIPASGGRLDVAFGRVLVERRAEARDGQGQAVVGRVVSRPANRLALAADGRVLVPMRHAWADGTAVVALDPVTFLGRLAVLVPRPRINRSLY